MKKILVLLVLCFFLCSNALAVTVVVVGRSSGGGEVADPTDQFSGGLVYSVGTTATELDNEGTITVASNIATFSIAFPTNVGVGDVVQYDVNNDASIGVGEYGIIRGISTDRLKAYLLLKDGSGVTNTTASTSVYDIFRAYNSITNFEGSTENVNVDADIAYGLTDLDITDAGDEDGPMYVACYDDGTDSTKTLWNSWTTSATNFVKFFTPTSTAMVGTSQRHTGVYGSGYELSVSDDYAFQVSEATEGCYLIFEGITILTAPASHYKYGLYVDDSVSGDNLIQITDCIFEGPDAATYVNAQLGIVDPNAVVYIWNNLFDNGSQFNDDRSSAIYVSTGSDVRISANTIIGSRHAVHVASGYAGTIAIQNNVAFDSEIASYNHAGGSFDTASYNGWNVTGDEGTSSIDLSSEVGADLFTNYAGGDFDVDPTGALYQAGTDLDAATPAVTDDIDGVTRHATTPSIGAFE